MNSCLFREIDEELGIHENKWYRYMVTTLLSISKLSDLVHEGAAWTPGIVRGSLSHFTLDFREAFCVVLTNLRGQNTMPVWVVLATYMLRTTPLPVIAYKD